MDTWLNFVLGNELDVSGTLIFEGLEHIASLKTISNADEVFVILYYLAQGFERLVKVAYLVADEDPRSKMKEIIGHEINAKFTKYLSSEIKIQGKHKKFLNLITDFYVERYNHIDYGNPKSKASNAYPTGEFSIYPDLLRSYVRKYCEPNIEMKFDGLNENMICNMEVKRFLHSVVKELAIKIYGYIRENSYKKNTYTYELRSDSKASCVFRNHDEMLLKKGIAIYELLLYSMKGKGFIDKYLINGIKPLELDMQGIKEIVDTINSETGFYEVLYRIDERIEEMKPERKEQRKLLHDYILGIS